MKRIAAAALAVGVLVTGAFAQMAARKPGAEQTRIGYFAGKWNMEGESKPSPMGPGGKFKGKETCEWFAGGFQLVCHSEGTGPMGAMKGQSTMGYDPAEKTYTYYAISSLGDGAVPLDTDDRTAHDMLDGKKERDLLGADEFLDHIRFSDNADNTALLRHQHTSDVVRPHELCRLHDGSAGIDRYKILSHQLLDLHHV